MKIKFINIVMAGMTQKVIERRLTKKWDSLIEIFIKKKKKKRTTKT